VFSIGKANGEGLECWALVDYMGVVYKEMCSGS